MTTNNTSASIVYLISDMLDPKIKLESKSFEDAYKKVQELENQFYRLAGSNWSIQEVIDDGSLADVYQAEHYEDTGIGDIESEYYSNTFEDYIQEMQAQEL